MNIRRAQQIALLRKKNTLLSVFLLEPFMQELSTVPDESSFSVTAEAG